MLKAITYSLQNYALRQTRVQLMGLSDGQLEDIGISRYLLERGLSEWPWREDAVIDQPAKMTTAEINKAVRELSAMTDQELRDVGVNRGSIRQAVLGSIEDRVA